MITSWHRPQATLVSDKRELSFVFSCDNDAWLDRLVDFVGLTFIQHYFLSDNFNQVICWWEAAVTLLYQPAKDIRYVVVHLVAVSQLLALLEDGVHSMMAPSEKLALTFLLLLTHAQMWALHLRQIMWPLGPIHTTIAAHSSRLSLTVNDVFIADRPL